MRKKFNRTLFLACLVGGLIGCAVGGTVYGAKSQAYPPAVMMGIYFAILAFFIYVPGVVSEWVTNHIKGRTWDGGETRMAVLLALGAVALFFILGALFQFLYGLGKPREVAADADDYIIMIDNSGSTMDTDPGQERFSAIVDFVDGLKDGQRVQVSVFEDTNQIVLPLCGAAEAREQLEGILSQYTTGNNTNIQAALLDSLDQYALSNRSAMAVLLSDGVSMVNVKEIADAYIGAEIPVFAIGFSNIGRGGRSTMSRIAESTGGCFYDIREISQLSETLSKLTDYKARRVLIDYRPGTDRGRVVYMVLRVLFLFLLGAGMGIPLIFILDSEDLFMPAIAVRGFACLIVGLLMEWGLYQFLSPGLLRLLMCLGMALVVSYYTEPQTTDWMGGFGGYQGRTGSQFQAGSGVGKRNSGFRNNNSAFGDKWGK